MGVFYESIPRSLINWCLEQKCFWVATAPLSGSGHVNLSPKGGPYFGIIDERTFWYQDLTGSGSETISHLHEPGNGRVVIMFNAFDGPPKIVRFWGKGRALEFGTDPCSSFISNHKINTLPHTRSIIIVDIDQVGSSCGFSVPYYDFKEFRPVLNDHFEKKHQKYLNGNEKESMDRYWAFKNSYSIDGLPAMKRAMTVGKQESIKPLKKMVGPLAPKNIDSYGTSEGFTLEQMIIVFIAAFIAGIMAVTLSPAALNNILAFIGGGAEKNVRLPKNFRQSI